MLDEQGMSGHLGGDWGTVPPKLTTDSRVTVLTEVVWLGGVQERSGDSV